MRLTLSALLIASLAIPLVAADISTLATAAVQGSLTALAKAYTQQSGHQVKVQFDTSPNITRRLDAGEMPDVLIATSAIVDRAIKDGKAIAGTRALIGKMAVGVAMAPHALKPNLATPETLKAALLGADAVVYSQGASGVYIDALFKNMGIAGQIQGKIVKLASGADVMKRLGESHGNEIGFTMVSEIKEGSTHGGSLVGPLPAAIQSYTTYDAVVMAGSSQGDAAREFIRAVTAPAARKVLTEAGWEF